MNEGLNDAHVRAWVSNAAHTYAKKSLDGGFKPQALHTYADADGSPLFWRIRLKHPETKEKWIRPMSRVGAHFALREPTFENGKPLYGLHRLAGNPAAGVWVVEGETKVDALNRLELVAVTSGAATSAASADWKPLRGRAVRIWPDNDEPGKAYAGEVASTLLGMGCAVSCIDVDKLGLGVGDDVVEWLAAHPGAALGDIEALPMLTPSLAEKNATASLVVVGLHEFLTNDLPAREEILTPWLLSQSLSMIYSWRGVGKTHVALGIAYAIASGSSFLGWTAATARKVLYIDGEMPAPALQERLAAIIAASDVQPELGMLNIVTPDLQSGAMPDLATREGQDVINGVIGDAEVIIVEI